VNARPRTTSTAKELFRQALWLAEQLEMRPLVARYRLGLGRLHGRVGQLAAARAELEAALLLFRSMGMDTPARWAEAELAGCGVS
jgi:hypothetical protein